MPYASALIAAHRVLGAAALYVALGVAVALPFVLFGAKRAVGQAGAVTAGARLLLLAAAAALWPLVLRRWVKGAPR